MAQLFREREFAGCCQAWRPECDPKDWHGEIRREPTLVLAYVLPCTSVHACGQAKQNYGTANPHTGRCRGGWGYRLDQEDHCEFKASLDYMYSRVRVLSTLKSKQSSASYYVYLSLDPLWRDLPDPYSLLLKTVILHRDTNETPDPSISSNSLLN